MPDHAEPDYDAIIVGAGINGLSQLHRLRDELGLSVRVFEAEWFNPIMVEVNPEGGHFTAWENPAATVEGIRSTMRQLRGTD
jgi:hypothetical protein